MRVPMVSRSKKLKSRMKSGASASTQRSASRPRVGSASMSMRMARKPSLFELIDTRRD